MEHAPTVKQFLLQVLDEAASDVGGLRLLDEAAIAMHAQRDLPIVSRIAAEDAGRAAEVVAGRIRAREYSRYSVRVRNRAVTISDAANRLLVFRDTDQVDNDGVGVEPLPIAVAQYLERMQVDSRLPVFPLLTAYSLDSRCFRECATGTTYAMMDDLSTRYERDLRQPLLINDPFAIALRAMRPIVGPGQIVA